MTFNLEAVKQALDKLYNDFKSYDGESRYVPIEITIENGDVSNDKLVDLIRFVTYSEHNGEKVTRTIEVFTDKHEPEFTVNRVIQVKIKKN